MPLTDGQHAEGRARPCFLAMRDCEAVQANMSLGKSSKVPTGVWWRVGGMPARRRGARPVR
jgi:hypothetical protein